MHLLEQLDGDRRRMPATIIYNEGWLLRLVLDLGENGWLPTEYMDAGSYWFSEAQLRTPFGKKRGPNHESNTRADGAVGDFRMGADTKSGLELSNTAKRFVVFEAKLKSPLRPGTTNAPGYDQAARYVACMAYTLQRARRKASDFEQIGFYVLAPEQQIQRGIFRAALTEESIRARIEDRIRHYGDSVRSRLENWRDEWAWPLLERMTREGTLKCVAWETLIQAISDKNAEEGELLRGFYEKCKEHNRPAARAAKASGRPERGREYYVRGGERDGLRVRVCSPGNNRSRVHASNDYDDVFLAPNTGLEVVPDAVQTPAPPRPLFGQEYWWDRAGQGPVRVRIRKVGNYRSRVIRLDENGDGFKVPNHQLRLANNG